MHWREFKNILLCCDAATRQKSAKIIWDTFRQAAALPVVATKACISNHNHDALCSKHQEQDDIDGDIQQESQGHKTVPSLTTGEQEQLHKANLAIENADFADAPSIMPRHDDGGGDDPYINSDDQDQNDNH